MKILLTGSSGFIGTYFMKTSIYDIVPFSLRKNAALQNLTLEDIDVVVHLAAIVHQMKGAPDGIYQEVNVEYPLLLAKKAKESGVKQFVFMSSVKVYGEESETVYTETTPCYPKDAYGKSKLEAEKVLLALENKNFKVAIIRTPVVYGKGVKANILNLVKLVDEFPLLPFGKINNKRSMVYVGNLVHMINEIIRQEKNGIFLASDDKPVSTSKLITTIAEKNKKKVWLFSCSLVKYFLKWFKPMLYKRLYCNLYIDNTKSKKELDLLNPYTFDEGIANMVKSYES